MTESTTIMNMRNKSNETFDAKMETKKTDVLKSEQVITFAPPGYQPQPQESDATTAEVEDDLTSRATTVTADQENDEADQNSALSLGNAEPENELSENNELLPNKNTISNKNPNNISNDGLQTNDGNQTESDEDLVFNYDTLKWENPPPSSKPPPKHGEAPTNTENAPISEDMTNEEGGKAENKEIYLYDPVHGYRKSTSWAGKKKRKNEKVSSSLTVAADKMGEEEQDLYFDRDAMKWEIRQSERKQRHNYDPQVVPLQSETRSMFCNLSTSKKSSKDKNNDRLINCLVSVAPNARKKETPTQGNSKLLSASLSKSQQQRASSRASSRGRSSVNTTRLAFAQLASLDEATVLESLDELNTMDLHSRKHKKTVAEAIERGSAVMCVLQALRNHGKKRPEICESALRLLLSLSATNQGTDLSTQLAELDGAILFLDLMNHYLNRKNSRDKHNREMIEVHGLGLLCNLCALGKEECKHIVEHKGVQVIVDSMKVYPDSNDIQRRGSKCLGLLVTSSGDQGILGKEGKKESLAVLVKAQDNHGPGDAVTKEARRSIKRLTK